LEGLKKFGPSFFIKVMGELKSLMNVRDATLKDLALLDIKSVEKLANFDPEKMFSRLEEISGKQDMCVLMCFVQ